MFYPVAHATPPQPRSRLTERTSPLDKAPPRPRLSPRSALLDKAKHRPIDVDLTPFSRFLVGW